MKLDPAEARIVQSMVDWYLEEAAGLWREAERNAAFFMATKVAMDGLNRAAEERFVKVFSTLLGTGPEADLRFAALRAEWASAVRARLGRTPFEGPVNVGDAILERAEARAADLTLSNYLHIMTSCLEAARGDDALRTLDRNSDPDVGRQFSRTLWAALRSARVFDLPKDDFVSIWRASDIYTTEKIAKRKWSTTPEDMAEVDKAGPEVAEKYRELIDEAGRRVPFPEQLPFDHTYIGLGHGVPLQDYQWSWRVHEDSTRGRVIGVGLLGYLIWNTPEGGEAVELLHVVEVEDNYILPNLVCHQGVWLDPMLSLGPWLVTHMIGLINEHRQLVLQPQRPSFAQRRDYEKKGKQLKVPGLVPKPYYLVRLEKKLIEETGKRNRDRLAKISRELSYRHDRRGHERCYIRRGKLPLEPKDGKKLEDAGYKVWTINEPDSTAYRQLMERGQPPKSSDEWIAILTRWIDPQVVGPDDKPYIPAIRIPTRDEGAQRPTAAPGVPRES